MRVRDHECLRCHHKWTAPLRYSISSPALSGEPTERCPLCGGGVGSAPAQEAGAWLKQHNAAMAQPRTREERFFVCMLDLWGSYAGAYFDRYGSPIGEDGVLGPEWQRIGAGMLGLLNGAHGRLDAGTLDAAIRNTIRACGGSVE